MSGRRRVRITVSGIVQGVGFRPFLHRLAQSHQLNGWVRNTSSGVELELEGAADALDEFVSDLRHKAPPLAVVEDIAVTPLEGLAGYSAFTIRNSRADGGAGLGLAVVRAVAEAHGGGCWAANRPGGVTFTVQLPGLQSTK